MANIILVEDSPIARVGLSKLLRLHKFRVDEAADGERAIKLLEVKRFDAAIVDYRIPGELTGLDVLRYCHQLSRAKVKVLISGLDDSEVRDGVKAIRGIYLRKPFAIEDLLDILKHTLMV